MCNTPGIKNGLWIGEDAGLQVERATVNSDSLPGDERSGIAEQENSGIADVSYNPHATSWNTQSLVFISFWSETIHAFGSSDGSRRNNIGTDTIRAFFNRQHSWQGIDTGFRSGDVSLEGSACGTWEFLSLGYWNAHLPL